MGNRPPLQTLKTLRPQIPVPPYLRSASLPYIIILLVITLLWGCSRNADLPVAGTIADFMPLQTGNSVTYRLDSIVFPAQGNSTQTRTHVVRDRVDTELRDQQGRQTWRIIRSLRNPVDTTRWADHSQSLATPTANTLEWLENNLRTIRLAEPVRDGHAWQGNRYVNTATDPDKQYLDGWTFTYRNAGKPWQLGEKGFAETLTVVQQDDRIGNPADRNRFSSIDVAREVYAKGIGLVYREVRHEVWQPPNASSATGYFEAGSFALTLSFLSSN
jgi:hypothetical protein